MGIYEVKGGLATKEFTLDISSEGYHLTVVAYGGIETEDFKTLAGLDHYLLNTWNFTEEQVLELIGIANISKEIKAC